jgi:hypothetical protein
LPSRRSAPETRSGGGRRGGGSPKPWRRVEGSGAAVNSRPTVSEFAGGPSAPGGRRLRGRWLVAARLCWLAVTLPVAALFLVGLPVQYAQFRTLSIISDAAYREIARANLLQLGLSVDFYAAYYVALGVLLAAACFAVAAVLFVRRSDEPMALFVALTLVLLGTTFTDSTGTLAGIGPVWERLGGILESASLAFVFLFFFLFPDGRFSPRWTRWLAALYVAYAVPAALFPGSLVSLENGSALAYALVLSVILLAGLFAQVHRYRRVSSQVERQQTKWVVFGFAAALAGYLGVVSLQAFLPSLEPGSLADLAAAGAVCGFMLFIPLSIGVAVLRYRLWDVDFVINRALVYGSLTVLLALAYFVGIVTAQGIFRALTGEESQLAIVVSTLGLAAIFNPLRRRTQSLVDRRFYRRKYDSRKTLQAFSTKLRDETHLEALNADLVGVVRETMQPTHVSVWLRPDSASKDDQQAH